jgi:hypothetical protein
MNTSFFRFFRNTTSNQVFDHWETIRTELRSSVPVPNGDICSLSLFLS